MVEISWAVLISAFFIALGWNGALLWAVSQLIDRSQAHQEELRREASSHWQEQFRRALDGQNELRANLAETNRMMGDDYIKREDMVRMLNILDRQIEILRERVEATNGTGGPGARPAPSGTAHAAA